MTFIALEPSMTCFVEQSIEMESQLPVAQKVLVIQLHVPVKMGR